MDVKSQAHASMGTSGVDVKKRNEVIMTREEAVKKRLPKGYAYEPILPGTGVLQPQEAVGESEGKRRRLASTPLKKGDPVFSGKTESSKELSDNGATGGNGSSKRKSMNLNAVAGVTQGHRNGMSGLESFSGKDVAQLRQQLLHQLEEVREVAGLLAEREGVLRHAHGAGTGSDSADYSRQRVRKIESGAVEMSSVGEQHFRDGGLGETAQSGTPMGSSAKYHRQMSLQVSETSAGGKEKRTPKANSAYINPDFFSGSDKMPPPEKLKPKGLGSKKSFSKGAEPMDARRLKVEAARGKRLSEMMKMCTTLLNKLLAHKYAWVFDKPVDVEGLGLHDYFQVIKKPMDLGTVKRKLKESQYPTPVEFYEDVQQVWTNAMLYNGEGHDVHIMAVELKKVTDEQYRKIREKIVEDERKRELEDSLPDDYQDKSEVLELERRLQKLESKVGTAGGKTKGLQRSMSAKDKLKDVGKREMTLDEKQRLGENLGKLTGDQVDKIVQIISQREPGLSQNGDEIELDIDSLDTDTLWELERFVSDCLKPKGRLKRKSPLGDKAPATSKRAESTGGNGVGKAKEDLEDSIDIEDEGPNAGSVAPQKGPAKSDSSGSSGSSDDSSSSSDSDSGSGSSGSDSDADAQSKDAGSKASAKKEPASSHGASCAEGSAPTAEADAGKRGLKESAELLPPIPPVQTTACDVNDEKSVRAALLQGKYADIILNAQKKAAIAGEGALTDPKKLREIEKRQREERARLEAEARLAQEARRKKEMEELEELKKKREAEREAERRRLHDMEKTVEIDENLKVLKDLKRLGGMGTPTSLHGVDSGGHTPMIVPTTMDRGIGAMELAMGGGNLLDQFGLVRMEDDDDGLTHEEDDNEEDGVGVVEKKEEDLEEGEI